MASGASHDRIGYIATLPLAVVAINSFPPASAVCFIYSYLVGITWLSPDLDIPQSEPSQRWAALRRYWKPYQKMMKHRGASHLPFIGTLTRLGYLLPLAIPVIYSLMWAAGWGIYDLIEVKEEAAALFIGLEVSAWVHLILDYTPILRKL